MLPASITIAYTVPITRHGVLITVPATVTLRRGKPPVVTGDALTDAERQQVLAHHHATELHKWAEFLESP